MGQRLLQLWVLPLPHKKVLSDSQMLDNKVCTHCLLDKPLESFPKDKYRKAGRKSRCKLCEASFARAFRANNPQKSRDTSRKYREANPEKERLRYNTYNKNNPEVRASNTAKRRFCKNKATPPWLTKSQIKEIEDFYLLAKDCEVVSGERYHVDHIVPLKGLNVCGLHVPWNLQVLPADINRSKGNSYEEAE
jgi:hypothetical protein